MALLHADVDAHVAAGHDEGIAGQVQLGSAVGVLDGHAVNGIAGLGGGDCLNLGAGRGGGDTLAVDVEGQRTGSGIQVGGELIGLLRRGGAAGAARRRAAGARGTAGRGAGSRGSIGDGGGHWHVEGAADLDVGQVAGVVQRLQQRGVGVEINAVLAADGISGITGDDLMAQDRHAGGAGGGLGRHGQEDALAHGDVGPVGDAVDGRDLLGIVAEVDAQRSAHARDGVAALHDIRHHVVGDGIAGGSRSAGGGRRNHGTGRSGGSGAGRDSGAGHDGDGVLVGGGQRQHLADRQLVPLPLGNVVELHDRRPAGLEVQTEPLADPQNVVSLDHGILDGIPGRGRVCVRADGQPGEQGHDHEHRKQDAYEPFFHNCSP